MRANENPVLLQAAARLLSVFGNRLVKFPGGTHSARTEIREQPEEAFIPGFLREPGGEFCEYVHITHFARLLANRSDCLEDAPANGLLTEPERGDAGLKTAALGADVMDLIGARVPRSLLKRLAKLAYGFCQLFGIERHVV